MEGEKKIRKQHSLLLSALKHTLTHTHTHQGDNGALGGELCGAEQRPDEAVDLLLLGVVFFVIRRKFRLLQQKITNDNERFTPNKIVYRNGSSSCCGLSC